MAWRSVRFVWRCAPVAFSVSVFTQIIGGAATGAQAIGAGRIVAGLAGQHRSPSGLAVGLTIGATLVALIADQLRSDQQRLVSEYTTVRATDELLEAIAWRKVIEFDDPTFSDRVSRAQTDAVTCPPQIAAGLLVCISSLASLLALGIAVIHADVMLAVIVAVAAVPLLTANLVSSRLNYRFAVDVTPLDRRRAYLIALGLERLVVPELRAYGLADELRGRARGFAEARLERLKHLVRRRILVVTSGLVASGALMVAAVVVLTNGVQSGRIPVSGAVASAAAVFLALVRVGPLTASIALLRESSLFVNDVDVLLAEANEVRERAARVLDVAPPLCGPIEMIGVSFSYPASAEPSLVDIDLRIEPGEVIALVGANGAGKSTLARLLAALYTPSTGTVRYGGVAIDIEDPRWRDRFGVVFQHPARLLVTVREMIIFGDVGAHPDHGRLTAAIAHAGAEFVYDLPNGLDTQLGPQFVGGSDLSGGQWQRLAIARALYRNAPCVVFDEPTASLDPIAEAEMFANLRRLLDGRTAVMVTHRFSSCHLADRVVVLEDGRIIECGSHRQLLAAGGQYAAMYESQAAGFRDVVDLGALAAPVGRTPVESTS